MSTANVSNRKIARASRTSTVPPLTGREDVLLVEPNRMYNHGYKHFLAPAKIHEIFGERVARSKRIRKAKIRDILKNAMHTIDLEQGMVVDDFIKATEGLLHAAVAEVQAMKSSPVSMETGTITGKRRKAKSPSNEAVAAPAVAPAVPMEVVEEPKKVNPIENQLDFIIGMMTKSDVERSKMTARQVESEFKRAKMMDESNIERAQQRIAYEKKKQEKKERALLRGEINNEIADLFSRTGL